jgi:hypothetical protein
MGEPREPAEELHRLLGAVQEWAKRAVPEPTAPGECLPWCPICQFAHVLRGEHPEVAERIADAGAAVASALKALADATLPRPPAATRGADRPRPTPRVQHIDLSAPEGE